MKMDPLAVAAPSRETINKSAPIEQMAGFYSDKNSFMGHKRASLAHRALHRFLLDMVALIYEVKQADLVAKTRGRKKTALARQVAMYLAHTAGGLSLTRVGHLFGRDRTTVAHGCALIEDARDDRAFDRSLAHLESAIACQLEMFRLSNQTGAHTSGDDKGSQK